MDWKKFFSDPATVIILLTSGAVGFVIGVVNGVIQKRHGGWGGFFVAVASSVGVAIIVGLALHEYVKSETMRLAIIGVCAAVSDDIWAGFKALGGGFRKNPIDFFIRVLAAVRGQPMPPAPIPTPPETPSLSPKE